MTRPPESNNRVIHEFKLLSTWENLQSRSGSQIEAAHLGVTDLDLGELSDIDPA